MSCHNLTIDLEDQYAAPVLQSRNLDSETESATLRRQLEETLEFLEENRVTATFFTVSSFIDKVPEAADTIRGHGHEIACHGTEHKVLSEHTPQSFREMLIRARQKLGDIQGYRAPMFTLNRETSWAIKVLREEGFKYDSSVFPCWSPEYGVYTAPTSPYRISENDISKDSGEENDILEYPLLVYKLGPFRAPAAGGFYMRILPYTLIRNAVKKLDEQGRQATVYAHSWEISPENNKRGDYGWYCNTILYRGLNRARRHMEKLAREFKFSKITD